MVQLEISHKPLAVRLPCNQDDSGSVESSSLGDGEWALLELQGALEMPCDAETGNNAGTVSGVSLGQLTPVAGTRDEFYLTIGHHRLSGKRQVLKKPLAILEVLEASARSSNDGAQKDDNLGTYRLVRILRHKILFQSRPEHHVDVGET